MWTHRATRDNVGRLQRRLRLPDGPAGAGILASGQEGVGRLAELPRIVDAVVEAVGRAARSGPARRRARGRRSSPRAVTPTSTGRHVVVSAGGTAEAIDPVRFIGNRSTGKMGVAIAEAALARGARVTIVAGRVEVPLPDAAVVVPAESTAEMRAAVLDAVIDHPADALVMAAAVADFRPARPPRRSSPGRRPDPRARADRGHPRRGRRPRPRRWRPARSSSGSPRRPARSTGRPRSCARRARTSSSPTTSASPARASAPTPTGS